MLNRQSRSMSDDKARDPQHLTSTLGRNTSIDEPLWLQHGGMVQSPISVGYKKQSNGPSRTTIALALLITILGFTIQIEAIAYYQDVLDYPKPFFSLWLTHSSLAVPWIVHLLYLRTKRGRIDTKTWLRHYMDDLFESITKVDAYADGHNFGFSRKISIGPAPLGFLLGSTAIVTAVLTVSGVSWFVALAYTTPGDLTAIYNCSAFFAAIFSVPLLNEKLGRITVVAVALSIVGTMTIAYGDSGPADSDTAILEERIGMHRLYGNIVAAIGAVAFGLYSVVFKRWTSIQNASHTSSSFDLAIAASGLTGVYTFALGWIGIIVLHVLNIETFSMPSATVSLYLGVSIIAGAVSMTLMLLLVTWTTPVFGSVTSVLCVFFVAIGDWMLFGLTPSFATYLGGGLIFVAFGLLAQDGMS